MDNVDHFHIIMYSIIVVISLVNIFRVGMNLAAAEMEDYQKEKNKQRFSEENQSLTLSVVIPAYNEEKSIFKTLAAVAANDYLYKEIFVVDDGSTDRTAEIVKEFLQKEESVPITLIRQQNQGNQ